MDSEGVPLRETCGARGRAGAALALIAAGCGDDDEDDDNVLRQLRREQLSAVKDYLTEHSAALDEHATTDERAGRRSTTTWPRPPTSTTTRMIAENGEEVQRILDESKAEFVEANPSYEEMEGIVAGVPRLAQYDVDIDAGADATDPENAVSFSLNLPNGETLKQPGNLFFVTETALYGTNPDFLAKGVKGDVDGDGQVAFGEGLPTPTSTWRRPRSSRSRPRTWTRTLRSSSRRRPTRSPRSR